MSYPNVYLIRINDRPHGFRVVAVVAEDEDDALERCCDRFCAQSTNQTAESYAKIHDKCSVGELGKMATFTFQE